MLRAPLLLLTDLQAPVQALGRVWGRKPCVVLSRNFYVHLPLDGQGIPTRKMADFVALEIKRLAPYPDAEFCFVRSGRYVHAFAWSHSEVATALQQLAGQWRAALVKHGNTLRPESALGSLPKQARSLRSACEGVEGLQTDASGLKAIMWWPQPPSAAALAQFFDPHAAGMSSAVLPPLDKHRLADRLAAGSSRWSVFWPGQWVQGGAKNANPIPAGSRNLRLALFPAAAAAALLGSAFFAAWTFTAYQKIAAEVVGTQSALDRGIAQARSQVSLQVVKPVDSKIDKARKVSTGPDVPVLLEQLQRALPRKGLLVRNLVIEQGVLTLTLVSAWAEPVDLDEASSMLEAIEGFQSIEISDMADPKVVKFQIKLGPALLRSKL